MSQFDDETPFDPLNENPQDFPDEAGYDSGDNVEIDEATPVAIQDPILEKFQSERYKDKWCEELEASRKERKDFVLQGYQILSRWGNRKETATHTHRTRSNYNLFYKNTQLKQGAIFAQTPAPDIKRRFNDPNDQVSRVAGMVLSRCIEVELDEQNFDQTFNSVLFDNLVPGLGVAWLRLEQKGGNQVTGPHYGEQIPQTDPMTGAPVMDSEGNPVMVPHPLADQMVNTPITHQCAHIDHVSWDDFLWSPCRTWCLNRWVARRIPMSKQAIEDRFGNCCPEDYLKGISYVQDSDDNKKEEKDRTRTRNQVESTTDVFEIWDKELKMIWHICESCPVPLDVQEDKMNFPGFFPTPEEPLGTFDGSNTIPYPDYVFAQDLYEDIDDTHNRGINMIQAAQVKFAYDQSVPELADIMTIAGELQGIPVNNWSNFKEKGGLTGAMDFLPFQQMAVAAQALAAAKQQLVSDLDDIEGLNDLMKAETATNETNLATQMKGAFGTSRLAIRQKQAAKYVECLLRLQAHLICAFYTPQEIMKRIGTLTPQDQQLLPQAFQLLKDECMRGFKLEVSVDALQQPNWNLEKADKIQAFGALSQAITQALPAIQQQPQIAPLVLTAIQWLITGFKGAQYIEGEIDSMLTQLGQAAGQKAKQPPQPNPQMAKAQAIQQKTQADVQIAQEQEKTKRMDVMTNAQLDAQRLQIDQEANRIEAAKIAAGIHNQAKTTIHNQAIDQLDAHDQAKNSIHNHTMDRMDAQPDVLPIPIPVGKNGQMPHKANVIVAMPGQ